jgi:hypothetical protein
VRRLSGHARPAGGDPERFRLTATPVLRKMPPHPKETVMGRGDNRSTPKMRRKKSQAKLKARIKRKIATAKAAKKPAAPSKKK